MPTKEHQVDENEEVIYVKSFAAVVTLSFRAVTSVRVETAIEIMFSDVSA